MAYSQWSHYFRFTDCMKAFDVVNHNKPWKILKDMRMPEYLTCLLRNLYEGQEAAVRTGHGTTDCLKIGKRAYGRQVHLTQGVGGGIWVSGEADVPRECLPLK